MMDDYKEYAPVSADVLERLWPEPGTRPGTAWTHRRCGLVVTDRLEHDPKFGRFPCPSRRASTPFHPTIFDVGTEKKEKIMAVNQNGPTLAQRFISAAAGGPPSTSQRINMVDNTDAIRRAGERLERNTEPSREQSLALTHLEEALFWANKAVMLHDLSLTELVPPAEPAPPSPLPVTLEIVEVDWSMSKRVVEIVTQELFDAVQIPDFDAYRVRPYGASGNGRVVVGQAFASDFRMFH